jgi:hypothetical protein
LFHYDHNTAEVLVAAAAALEVAAAALEVVEWALALEA